MDYDFRIMPHVERPDTNVVEVWFKGQFVATITPGDAVPCGFRIFSKHMCGVIDLGIGVQIILDPGMTQ